jgi:hypothetical protein
MLYKEHRLLLTIFVLLVGDDVNHLKTEFLTRLYKNSVRTSQETHYVSATKPNQLMLSREELAVYCENHMEHNNTLCGQNAEFKYVKSCGTCSIHWALQD